VNRLIVNFILFNRTWFNLEGLVVVDDGAAQLTGRFQPQVVERRSPETNLRQYIFYYTHKKGVV
jgi:hypothetical protein